MSFDPSKIRVVKAVTRDLMKLEENKPVYITITSPMVQDAEAKDDKKEPPFLFDVTDLSEPEERAAWKRLIVPAVLRGLLQEGYPGDGYVGRSFELTNTGKKGAAKGGQSYNTFRLTEIEVTE